MNVSGASKVSVDVLEALAKLGGAVIGLSVFAYLAGYFYLLEYYQEFGISWVLQVAKVEDLLRSGFVPSGVFGITLAGGIYLFVGNKVKPGWLFLILIVLLLVPIFYTLYSQGWIISAATHSYAVMLVYAFAGLILAASIFSVLDVSSISNSKVTGVVLSILLGTFVAPSYSGYLLASQQKESPEQFLPKVSGKGEAESWFLVGYVSEKLILVRAIGMKNSQAILVEPGEDWKVGLTPPGVK